MARKKKNTDYINNEEFLDLLKEFQEINDDTTEWFKRLKPKNEDEKLFKEKKEQIRLNRIEMLKNESEEEKKTRIHNLEHIKNKLGESFLAICEGLLKRPNFINYDYYRKSEMVSDATYFMSTYVDRYDVNRPNPFAYFTQIAFNAFLQNINKHNKKEETFVPLTYIENMDSPTNKISEGVYDED